MNNVYVRWWCFWCWFVQSGLVLFFGFRFIFHTGLLIYFGDTGALPSPLLPTPWLSQVYIYVYTHTYTQSLTQRERFQGHHLKVTVGLLHMFDFISPFSMTKTCTASHFCFVVPVFCLTWIVEAGLVHIILQQGGGGGWGGWGVGGQGRLMYMCLLETNDSPIPQPCFQFVDKDIWVLPTCQHMNELCAFLQASTDWLIVNADKIVITESFSKLCCLQYCIETFISKLSGSCLLWSLLCKTHL